MNTAEGGQRSFIGKKRLGLGKMVDLGRELQV